MESQGWLLRGEGHGRMRVEDPSGWREVRPGARRRPFLLSVGGWAGSCLISGLEQKGWVLGEWGVGARGTNLQDSVISWPWREGRPRTWLCWLLLEGPGGRFRESQADELGVGHSRKVC